MGLLASSFGQASGASVTPGAWPESIRPSVTWEEVPAMMGNKDI